MGRIGILIIFAILTGPVKSFFSCLTWKIEDDKLQLICRLDNFVLPATFSDTYGRQLGSCSFNGVSSTCVSYHHGGNITSYVYTKEIVFSLEVISKTDINGIWTCSQGNNDYQTEVSTAKGISASTNLYLTGEVLSAGISININLTCFSCRKPHANNVEFLIDHQSVDNLHYDHISKKCFHVGEECNGEVCSCVSAGNEFTRVFQFDNIQDNLYFSCAMRFIDDIRSVILMKYTTLYFNGKDLIFNGTQTGEIVKSSGVTESATVISTNLPSTTSHTVDNDNNVTTTETLLLWSGVGIIVIVIAITICCVFSYRRWKKATNESTTTIEDNFLLSDQHDSDESVHTTLSMPESEVIDPLLDLENNKIRWLLVGICFYNIISPVLRKFADCIISELYSSLKESHKINIQTYSNHLKGNLRTSEEFNYEAINNNEDHEQKKDMYDYRIQNAVDLSKLYLPTNLNNYEDFGNAYDPLSLLDVLLHIDNCPENTRSILEQNRSKIQLQHKWPLCDFKEWDSEMVTSSFQLMEDLLKAIHLDQAEEANLTVLLTDWKGNGEAFKKISSCRNLERVKNQIYVLVENVQKIGKGRGPLYLNAFNELNVWLRRIEDQMKEKMKEEKENFSKLVLLVGDTAKTVVREFVGSKLLQSSLSDRHFRSYLDTKVHDLYHSWCSIKNCCKCEPGLKHEKFSESLLTKQQFYHLYNTDAKAVHFEHGQFCLCKVAAKEDVSMKAVDITIAQCFMKKFGNAVAENGNKNVLEYMEVIKKSRNKIATKASSKHFTNEQFTWTWKETEKAVVELARSVNDEFCSKTTNDIEAIKYQPTVENSLTHLQDILRECKEDLALMLHQDQERRFQKKIHKAGIERGIADMKKLFSESKKGVLSAKTDNVSINILKYPAIATNEDRKTIEVVLQCDIPDNWDEYKMMETVRRMCEQMTTSDNVVIKETTLDHFMMILEMLVEALKHEEKLRNDIVVLFNKILKKCNIDTSLTSVINVSIESLEEGGNTINAEETDLVRTKVVEKLQLVKSLTIPNTDIRITSLTIVDHDKYLIADSNNECLMFMENEKVTKTIKLACKPWSIVLMDDNIVLISLPTRGEVEIFNLGGKAKSIVKKMSGEVYSMAKRDGVSVFIFIEKLGICIYSLKTEEITKLSIEIPEFLPSSDEICYRNDRLYFCSRFSHMACCYDLTGNKIWEFKHPKLNSPTTITCDLFGNAFVTGYLSNNLFVISDDGKSCKELLTKKDHLKLPSFLYFCPKLKCLVFANRDNRHMARYDIIYK